MYQRNILLLLTALSFFLVTVQTFAKPVDQTRVRAMIKGLLKADSKPLGMKFPSPAITKIQKITAASGANYYIVHLAGTGLIITTADDTLEPVIAFALATQFDPNTDSPLSRLLNADLSARPGKAKNPHQAQKKWETLELMASSQMSAPDVTTISDVCVEPLIQSKWHNSSLPSCPSSPVYNYYTPNNYVTGCVAVAMSQLMRYHQHPLTTGVDPEPTYLIKVDGFQRRANLQGGDGIGGPYQWSQMPLIPNCTITEPQKQAIGSLCSDTGIAVQMSYTQNLSLARLLAATTALTRAFGYTNAVWGDGIDNSGAMTGLIEIVNPNLDASLPVILCIDGQAGHAVLADGYGYNAATLYHHLNMGWAGQDDVWYNLPTIQTSHINFNVITDCVYNIFVSGSGEIISGRVTTSAGAPAPNITVTAKLDGATYSTATTNSKGIFALKNLPSNTTFTITVGTASQIITTGRSANYQSYSGNKWGVNFVYGQTSSSITAVDETFAAEPAVMNAITLHATVNGQPAPGIVNYIVTSLPEHGKLFNPLGGLITAANLPYTIPNHSSTLNYQSCSYYFGRDTFNFKANNGSDSNIAFISVDIMVPYPAFIYQTDFTDGLPADWAVIDGGNDNYKWKYYSGYVYLRYPFEKPMMAGGVYVGTVLMDEQLVTKSFDFSNYKYITLGFSHEFAWDTSETGDIDVRLNGGQWQTVAKFQGDSFDKLVTLDVSSFVDGQHDAQFRWHYYNAYWHWCIDDVWIEAISLPRPTEGDFNVDCCVDASDLFGIVSRWLSDSSDPDWDSTYDISNPHDNNINFLDFAVFAKKWQVQ